MLYSHALPPSFCKIVRGAGLSKQVSFSASTATDFLQRPEEKKKASWWDPHYRLLPLEQNRFSIEAQKLPPYTPFPVLFKQANEAYRQGRFLKSLEFIALATPKNKPGTSADGGLLYLKGKNWVALGQYKEGLKLLENALAIFEKNKKSEFQKTPVYVGLGQAYLACANYKEASHYSDKAIAAYEKAFHYDYPDLLNYLYTVEASAEYRPLKALTKLLERLDRSGSLSKTPRKLLSEAEILTFADVLQLQGELFSQWEGTPWSEVTMAQLSLDQAERLYQKVSTRFHPYALQTLNLKGDLAKQSQHLQKARGYYRDVIRMFNHSSQQGNAMAYFQALLKLATLDCEAEQYTQVPQLLTVADKVLGQILGPYKEQHPAFARLLLQQGHLKACCPDLAGGKTSAQADFHRAQVLLERTLGPNHPEVSRLKNHLLRHNAKETPIFMLTVPSLQYFKTVEST